MKTKWRVALLALTAVACGSIAFSRGMDSAPQLTLRITAAVVVLSGLIFAIYKICHTRRFRLSTLMLVFPFIAALVASMASPYVRHHLLVDQLNRAGIVEYRMEPNQLEATLGYLADEILGKGFYSFSTNLTNVTIDLDTCKTENLRTVSGRTSLRYVYVGNRDNQASKFTPELISWLNTLSDITTVSILGAQLDDDDVESLSNLKHRASYRIGDPQSPKVIDFVYKVDAEQLVIGNFTLPDGYKRPETIGRARSLHIDQDSQIEARLIVDLIESKQIEDLVGGRCKFNIEECSRLAAVPGLSQIWLEGLGFDELIALSASKSLKTAHFLDPILTEPQLEQVQSAYTSVVGSLFFTKPKRRIIPLK